MMNRSSTISAIRVLPWLLLLVALTWVLGSLWRMRLTLSGIRRTQRRSDVALKKLLRTVAGETADERETSLPQDASGSEPTAKFPSDTVDRSAFHSSSDARTLDASHGKGLRIAVLTANVPIAPSDTTPPKAGSGFAWLYRMAFHNHREYCRRWNYDFVVEDSSDFRSLDRDPSWAKVVMARKWLPRYDWVAVVEIGAFFMRFDQPITAWMKEGRDVVAMRDWRGINTGVLLLRNSPATMALLTELWDVPQRHWEPHQEATALNHLLSTEAPSRSASLYFTKLATYPEDFAVGHDVFRYRNGDFIAQLPYCQTVANCRRIALSVFGASSTANQLKKVPADIPSKFVSPESPPREAEAVV